MAKGPYGKEHKDSVFADMRKFAGERINELHGKSWANALERGKIKYHKHPKDDEKPRGKWFFHN